MIYESSSNDIKVENMGSGTFVQILDGKTRCIQATDSDSLLQRKTLADLAHQESAEVSATTQSQTTSTKKKRVHFEDEVPEGTTTAEATEATTEDSALQAQPLRAEVQYEPTAGDIDQSKTSEVSYRPGPGRGAEVVDPERYPVRRNHRDDVQRD
ncbi:LOW QUALITY PROTEIN: hypothetical protein PHMEG_00010211 [Phytophthora megakarya]|uniref:Uncharacterized protein n=1 Tax=Phytophthora megakarya TaxID=4795 RepID=A0A225WG02_9STRA|nr:LOW QUALITY PROTEIN: hypothetical protein PHMEG_00010211 [Phytophthora megakarya]